MFELPLRDPIDEVVADLKAIDLYTDEFLLDLEDGLRKSSYAKKYANQTTRKRSWGIYWQIWLEAQVE